MCSVRTLMNWGRVLRLVAISVATILLTSMSVQARDCGTGVATCACGDTVVSNTTFSSTQVIDCGSDTLRNGLTINDNVFLNCNGATITRNANNNSKDRYGIRIVGKEGAPKEIKGCTVRNFHVGIRVNTSKNVVIKDVAVYDNGTPTVVGTSSGEGYGIEVSNSSYVEIRGTAGYLTVRGSGDEGIHISESNNITLSKVEIKESDQENLYLLNVKSSSFKDIKLQNPATGGSAASLYIKGEGRKADGQNSWDEWKVRTYDNDFFNVELGQPSSAVGGNIELTGDVHDNRFWDLYVWKGLIRLTPFATITPTGIGQEKRTTAVSFPYGNQFTWGVVNRSPKGACINSVGAWGTASDFTSFFVGPNCAQGSGQYNRHGEISRNFTVDEKTPSGQDVSTTYHCNQLGPIYTPHPCDSPDSLDVDSVSKTCSSPSEGTEVCWIDAFKPRFGEHPLDRTLIVDVTP